MPPTKARRHDRSQPGAGIICNHDCLPGSGPAGKILELLHKGGLKTADLEKALDAARAAELADDFDVIEPDIIDPPPPSNRPLVEWVRWLRERMEIQAGHVCEPIAPASGREPEKLR